MAKYNEIYKSQMDWQNVFVRTGNFPLDRSSIFGSYEDAVNYAKGDGSDTRGLGKTSYVGQIITVFENDVVSVYKITGKDIMDSDSKTVEIKERGLEELISKEDVNTLIKNNIVSEDFEKEVKNIIAETPITSKSITDFSEATKDIIAETPITSKSVTDFSEATKNIIAETPITSKSITDFSEATKDIIAETPITSKSITDFSEATKDIIAETPITSKSVTDFSEATKDIIAETPITSKSVTDFSEATKDIIAEENVMSNKVITDEKITIIGTPLAQIINPNNSLDITINDNTDLRTLLKMLFEQELYPTNVQFIEGTVSHQTTNITVSASLTANTYVEVGTKCIFNAINAPSTTISTRNRKISNITYGYSLENNNERVFNLNEYVVEPTNSYFNDGTYKFVVTSSFHNGINDTISSDTLSNINIEEHETLVNENENMLTINYEAPKVSAVFSEIPKIYLCSNLQKTNENNVIGPYLENIVTSTTNPSTTITFKVNGAWYSYIGGATSSFEFTSQNVRDVGKRTLRSKGTETVSVTNACEKVVIAFPNNSNWGELKTVKDNGSNTIITNEFDEIETVNVQGANGHGSCSYKVYVYTPKNKLNNGFNYTITIG